MKQLVVEMNHGNAGFFVYLEYVINAIHYCENTTEYYNLPSIDYGPITNNCKTNKFFDPNHGPNMFEYFFSLNEKAPDGMFQDRRDVNFWCCCIHNHRHNQRWKTFGVDLDPLRALTRHRDVVFKDSVDDLNHGAIDDKAVDSDRLTLDWNGRRRDDRAWQG